MKRNLLTKKRVAYFAAVLVALLFCTYAVHHFRVSHPQAPTLTSSIQNAAGTIASTTSKEIAKAASNAKTVTTASTYPPTYMHLVFDDEFNGFSRYTDANGNVTCNPGGTGTWQTVFNFCSRTQHTSNDEAEVYADPNFIAYLKNEPLSGAATDPENPFSVTNGVLSIKATNADAETTAAVGPWALYTSGLITTQFSFSQTYGYFEMRAELPAGRGLWPAFWLLPTDGNWPPEIDAMEAFGATSVSGQGAGQGGVTMIHYASHSIYSGENCGQWHDTGVDLTAGFHTYGVDVEPTGITYYFDGKPYATCPANTDADRPMYMLINLAVGDAQSWPGTPDSTTPLPAYLQVDYVRAYAN